MAVAARTQAADNPERGRRRSLLHAKPVCGGGGDGEFTSETHNGSPEDPTVSVALSRASAFCWSTTGADSNCMRNGGLSTQRCRNMVLVPHVLTQELATILQYPAARFRLPTMKLASLINSCVLQYPRICISHTMFWTCPAMTSERNSHLSLRCVCQPYHDYRKTSTVCFYRSQRS